MPQTIDYKQMVAMLRAAAAKIRANHELLSRLDSFGGDGDHGTTMLRAMTCMEKAIDACSTPALQPLLSEVGWAIMGVDGGATGPLLGTLLGGMADVTAGKKALDSRALAQAFEAGLAALQLQSKAKVGDKTMIDALVPAVGAMAPAAEQGAAVSELLRLAAEAAEAGAAATTQMQARFGRAKTLGPKSIGNPDAGATSIALIFRGFYEGANSNG